MYGLFDQGFNNNAAILVFASEFVGLCRKLPLTPWRSQKSIVLP